MMIFQTCLDEVLNLILISFSYFPTDSCKLVIFVGINLFLLCSRLVYKVLIFNFCRISVFPFGFCPKSSICAVLSGTKYGLKQTRGKFGLGAKMVGSEILPMCVYSSYINSVI